VVDFRNVVIVMTSNVGAETIKKDSSFGFVTHNAETDYKQMKSRVMSELKRNFRPEFLNRVDEVIVFHSLTIEEIKEIVILMANELRTRLKEQVDQGIDFVLTDSAKDFLAKEGYDPKFGARPLRRAIQKHIEDKLSEELLKGNIKKGDTVNIDVLDGNLIVG